MEISNKDIQEMLSWAHVAGQASKVGLGGVNAELAEDYAKFIIKELNEKTNGDEKQ